MIYENTRYRLTPTTTESKKQKEVFTSRPLFNFPSEGSVSHIWQAHDRLDVLAFKHYGVSQLWWVLLEANPKYKWEGDISVGDTIIIPDIEMVVDRI